MKAKILKALLMALGVNAALFAVFFFDLDGKLLFYDKLSVSFIFGNLSNLNVWFLKIEHKKPLLLGML